VEGAGGGDVDVLVVGAGITGIYQLYRALEAGFSAVLLEAGGGVGGTWYWNRYPGARFDSESYTYGYLFSEALFDEWEWQEHFAGQPEVERYLNHVVDTFDLRRHMRFGARVTAARYDEDESRWEVTTAAVDDRAVDDRAVDGGAVDGGAVDGGAVDGGAGTTWRTRFLVAATGVLSVPHFPDVPGRDVYRGEQYHTGRWPEAEVTFAGKRVAVVGTGSSGVQLVPVVAAAAASLTVYQRTPNWCTPLNNAPITPEEQADLRARFAAIRETLNTSPSGFLHQAHDRATFEDPPEQRRAFYERMWRSPGFSKLTSHYTDLLFDPAANAEWCAFIAAKVRAIVRDPATADALIPKDHRFGEHRPPFVAGYYEAFNLPTVSLVDLHATPMVRVTERGIETSDGEREFDIVVWATGFDFGTGALRRMGIRGRGGLPLEQHWAEGPRTFLGIQTTQFPNLFFPGGPHAAAGNNPRYNGDQVDFITDTLVYVRDRGATAIEVRPEAEAAWTAMVDRGATRSPSFGERSYYFGTNVPGKPRKYLLNSGGRPKLFKEIARVKAEEYGMFVLSGSPTPARAR
jgi:cation diffusion facilitator CzcD-associated flavoprotein CzcO